MIDKHLYRLFRAVDLIVGLCGDPAAGEIRLLGFWNEEDDDGPKTKIVLLSTANTFTHVTVTISNPLSELTGKGQLFLGWDDAAFFRKDFQNDDDWHLQESSDGILLERNSASVCTLKLMPFDQFQNGKLRQGAALAKRTRHFTLSVSGMKSSERNLEAALQSFQRENSKRTTPKPTPSRFKFEDRGGGLEIRSSSKDLMNASYPFVAFDKAAAPLVPHRELAIQDMRALWQTLPAYGEDASGHIADSEAENEVAFCVDHTFTDGDRILYVSPMVTSVQMHRALICEDFEPDQVEEVAAE